MSKIKTYYYIIAELEEQFKNTGESGIILNNSIENVDFLNREFKVVSAPNFVTVSEGDYVTVHHNIGRPRYTMHGELVPSEFYIKDNLYFIPLTEVYLHRKKEEETHNCLNPFCFIKPVEYQSKSGLIETGSMVKGLSHKGYQKSVGELHLINTDLKGMGLEVGDKIVYSKNSEHMYTVGKEVLYRMKTKDILAKL